jgi:MoaA/NifB/PqqE/SkfB family radical SAM enzyme
MVSGPRVWAAQVGIAARAARVALRGRGVRDGARALALFLGGAERRRGFPLPRRRVEVAGRQYFDPTVPGWPSPAFDRFVAGEMERIAPTCPGPPPLQLAIFAVTRRCPLACAHCSEWELRGGRDTLSLAEVVEVARDLAAQGVVSLELSGGEPMERLDAVEAVCRELGPTVDTWVLTSGHGLDASSSARLRACGAVGVAVSLDHWEPGPHDAFRGRKGTFAQAVEGARAAYAEGLVVALSFTATRETATADGLARLLRLGREVGAGFLRILEPRAVGRWAGQDVALAPGQVEGLLRLAREVNGEASDLPIVELPAHSQRTVGCFGAGDRYLFVDAEGRAHACPFCRGGAGSVLAGGMAGALARLRARGCHAFPGARVDGVREVPLGTESRAAG